MSGSLLSSSWYRVAQLKPRVRSHARFHRHHYRGQLWYVLQDPSTGRCQRLTPAAYQVAGLMNGERTVHEVWEIASTRLGDDGPTQDETIRLLGQLHFADLLRCDVSPDTLELFRRCQRREQAEWWRRYTNPLSIRLPLLDPDALLERWQHLVRPLFTRAGFTVWCLVVGAGAVLALANASDIAADAPAQLLAPRNLLVLWLVYPIVKALHELGHAFATKVWGGEVHETGILFLVFMPLPYVDASAAGAFPDKWRRIVVGAAGIFVELFLATIALCVWLNTEPGLVHSMAYNVMWIGGASTLLFNGNPLLRFDGYYVLADAVEIPNLGQRSSQYLAYLVLHDLFGIDKVRDPVLAPGEERWFLGYAVASFLYRLAILVAIALFVAGRFFLLGVLLALFVMLMQVVVPAVRHVSFLLTSPRLGEQRPRALAISGGAAVLAAALLLLLPAPLFTRAQGVVWPPEGAQVRAGADGFVVRVLAAPDSAVSRDEPLILTRAPDLEARVAVGEARLRELRARYYAERLDDLVRAQITQDEIATVEADLSRARERAGEVVIRSPGAGIFQVPRAADLEGRYVRQGELLGYVVGDSIGTARVVLPQGDVALVRDRTEGVELRLASRLGAPLAAQIRRELPGATDRLPSAALGAAGGGPFATDPADAEHLRTLETLFQVELALPQEAQVQRIGERVHVRFDHGSEPLARRAYRGLRRLFLRRVGV